MLLLDQHEKAVKYLPIIELSVHNVFRLTQPVMKALVIITLCVHVYEIIYSYVCLFTSNHLL